MSVVIGRRDRWRDLERLVDRLREGHGGATVLFGEPGIGKSALLTAMVAYAKSLDLPVKHWRRLPGETEPWEPGDGVLLILDDLHRLPGHFAPALEALIERTHSRPILLAAAHRPRQLPVEVAAVLFRAVSAGTLRSHTVGALTLADARQIFGDRPDLARIHRDGHGNPAYMRVLAADSPDTSDAADVFSSELAQLTEAEMRVARLAAALGDSFSPDLLAAVATATPGRTLATLDALVARDLLRPVEPAPLLAFRHPVVAGLVYGRIPVSRRRATHRRIEAELGRRGAPVTQRAFHIARAADPTQVDTLLEAAGRLVDTNPQVSIEWLEVALPLIPEPDKRRHEAQLLLARARMLAGQLKQSREVLHTLLAAEPAPDLPVLTAALLLTSEVEWQLGNHRESDAFARLARTAAPSGHGLAARLHRELADHAIESLSFEEAARHATTAARHARSDNDRATEIRALSLAALAQFSHGRPADPEPAIARAAGCADAVSDAALLRDLTCLYQLAHVERILERFGDAERHARRGLALCHHSGQSHVAPAILKTLGDIQLRRGRLPDALETLDTAARHARDTADRPSQALIAVLRANTLVWLRSSDDTAEAIASAEEALSACGGLDSAYAVVVRAMAAEAFIHAGEHERGAHLMLQAAGGWELPRLAGWRRPRYWDLLIHLPNRAGGDAIKAETYARLTNVYVDQWPSATRRGLAARAAALRHIARGYPDRASSAGDAARDHFDAAEAALDTGQTLVIIANACLDNGWFDGVAGRLDRAAEIAAACGSQRLAEQARAARQRLGTDEGTPGGRHDGTDDGPRDSTREDRHNVVRDSTREDRHNGPQDGTHDGRHDGPRDGRHEGRHDGPRNGASPLALAKLTARESEVAELVSTGLTNGQIAARLRLSVRTVDCHVGRVYHKLGVPNRAGLARLLAQNSP